MLFLDRKIGETILVGDEISIVVSDIYEDDFGRPVVSLGIDAPRDIPIFRLEVKERIEKNARLARRERD